MNDERAGHKQPISSDRKFIAWNVWNQEREALKLLRRYLSVRKVKDGKSIISIKHNGAGDYLSFP